MAPGASFERSLLAYRPGPYFGPGSQLRKKFVCFRSVTVFLAPEPVFDRKLLCTGAGLFWISESEEPVLIFSVYGPGSFGLKPVIALDV